MSSNTQSHTRAALQFKLDELTRSTSGAHNVMLKLEDLSLEAIETFRTHDEKLAMMAREKLRQGQADTASLRSPLGSSLRLVEMDSCFLAQRE